MYVDPAFVLTDADILTFTCFAAEFYKAAQSMIKVKNSTMTILSNVLYIGQYKWLLLGNEPSVRCKLAASHKAN